MATSKELRSPPPRRLDNYVVSIKKLFGEPDTLVPDAAFSNDKYIATYQRALEISVSPVAVYSDYKSIGFEFEINNKKYKDFAIYGGGWMVLKDPDGGTIGSTFWHDILDETAPTAGVFVNSIIKSSFLYDHILLAPWFEASLPVARTIDELQSTYYNSTINTSLEQDIISGKDSRYWPYDLFDHGARYINGYDSKKGKYLLVRWTTSQAGYKNRLKFEVVLYENGVIEYKYWPIRTFEAGDFGGLDSLATVGIFWSSSTSGTNKFRDFAPILDYNKELRNISELGGSSYSSTYTESSAYWLGNPAAPYSVNISNIHWPKNGAIITLTPPTRSGKFLPRKISSLINSSHSLVSNGGSFDDRKTINFSSQGNISIHMPSTLPSKLMGDSSADINISSRQLLFTSGSLQITGSPKVAVIDSHLETLNVLDKLNAPFNNSFNESSKNYQETAVTSSFYATGSALEIFGDGFTAPLKSKTQFHFSLPVTKQTMMPSSTSSFYYYDIDRKTWEMADPNGYRNPERIYSEFIDFVTNNPSGYADAYGTSVQPIYRVTETSRGFDAVGRKIVSGSNINNFTYDPLINDSSKRTYQTDNAIGSVYNTPLANSTDSEFLLYYAKEAKDAITREYNKSITDNSDFFPQKSQMFNSQIEQPFLLEKVVVEIPFYISGAWFNDLTTCTRPFAYFTGSSASDAGAIGRFFGPIDFGGPGLTFSLSCPRKGEYNSYLDIIATGTITHINDAIADVVLKKDPYAHHHSLRPTGFYSFSNPSYVVFGNNNIFEGTVKLELEASIASGLTFARNDRSYLSASNINDDQPGYQTSNRNKAIELLTNSSILTAGEDFINNSDRFVDTTLATYQNRSPKIYIQQISPLSRGSAKFNFNGNSILGGNIASFNLETVVKNPLYSGYTSSSLPAKYVDQINSASFGFDAVSMYSTVDSRPSPYLILPNDKLTISISKTRPVIHKAVNTGQGPVAGLILDARYETYILTGSHGTVMLNTGSINITLYGSYIREGVEYHP